MSGRRRAARLAPCRATCSTTATRHTSAEWCSPPSGDTRARFGTSRRSPRARRGARDLVDRQGGERAGGPRPPAVFVVDAPRRPGSARSRSRRAVNDTNRRTGCSDAAPQTSSHPGRADRLARVPRYRGFAGAWSNRPGGPDGPLERRPPQDRHLRVAGVRDRRVPHRASLADEDHRPEGRGRRRGRPGRQDHRRRLRPRGERPGRVRPRPVRRPVTVDTRVPRHDRRHDRRRWPLRRRWRTSSPRSPGHEGQISPDRHAVLVSFTPRGDYDEAAALHRRHRRRGRRRPDGPSRLLRRLGRRLDREGPPGRSSARSSPGPA